MMTNGWVAKILGFYCTMVVMVYKEVRFERHTCAKQH
jgi:hypothetical protein